MRSPTLEKLIGEPGLAPLGPNPRASRWPVAKLDPLLEAVFAEEAIAEGRQPLFRAAILLWHDHLDASHTISQGISSRDGSLLHGIMHRREPDYGNAKYWFHRVGSHTVFPDILAAVKASPNLKSSASAFVREARSTRLWDPVAFIDGCEEAASLPDDHPDVVALRVIQEIETRSLLRHFLDA
jgi:hypothetical protein